VQASTVPGSLRVVSGEELVRCWEPPSGAWKCYCSACGGALWSRPADDTAAASIRLDTFDEDPGIRPSYRQFVAYAVPWEPIPDDGLPRFDERRPSDWA
jgi:hypothetical protein